MILRANDELLNKRNVELVDDLFATDYVNHGTKGDWGRDGIKRGVAALRVAFPDMHVKVGEFVVEGDRIAWQRTSRGTHEGEYEGIAGTGSIVTWRSIYISRIVDGEIVEEWSVGDLLEQIR